MFKVFECRSIRAALPDYVTHRLTSNEKDRVERHLASCLKCAELRRSTATAVDLAKEAREAPIPPSLTGWSDLRAQLNSGPGPAAGRNRAPVLVYAVACTLVGAFALIVALSLSGRRQPGMTVRNDDKTLPAIKQATTGRHQSASDGGQIQIPAPHHKAPPGSFANVPSLHGAAENANSRPLRPHPNSGGGGLPAEAGQQAGVEKSLAEVAPHTQTPEQIVPDTAQNAGKLPAQKIQSASSQGRNGRPANRLDDELAYLNPDPETSLTPWVSRQPDDIRRIEVELQQQVKSGDKFVTIPLPQIAGQGPAAVKAAVESQRKEAEIVDARLVRTIGLRIKGRSFADLCDHLSDTTGIRFAANRRVADDKVTLFCRPRPLREIMRLIAQHFGFAWIRKGEEGSYEYELTQTLRSQLLEEGLKEKDQEEMLLTIDRDMERFRKYRGMSFEQINAIKMTRDNFRELSQLRMGGIVAINLFFGLSQSEMATLRTGQPLKLNLMGRDASILPPTVLKGVEHTFDETYDRERKWAAEHGQAHTPESPHRYGASLQFDRSVPGEITLKGELTDGLTGLVPSLAVAKSPAFKIQNAQTNSKLAKDPDLQRPISLKLEPTCTLDKSSYPDTDGVYIGAGPKVTTADVMERLFTETGVDIISDCFSHLQSPASLNGQDQTLFAGLNRLGDEMRMRWTKTGSGAEAWLQFRTGTFYYDRPQEIPARLLERWKSLRKRQGVLSLDDLTEIGQLPDAQLDSVWMADAAIAQYGLDEWQMGRIAQLRPHWRFLGKLNDAQRKAVWSDKGLAYGELSADLQNQFLSLAFDNDPDRPGRRQIRSGNVRVLYAFQTHPLHYGGSYSVLISNPLLFVYTNSTEARKDRMAIVGPFNGIYGMSPEMLKPDAFEIQPGLDRR